MPAKKNSKIKMNIKQLENLALFTDELFRKYSTGFICERYPKGCCSITSDLLGAALLLEGYSNVKKVYQGWNKDGSHAWIDLEGIIIDITFYQFENNKKNLPYVGMITPWHESFGGRIEEIINPEVEIRHWRSNFKHTGVIIEMLRRFLRNLI